MEHHPLHPNNPEPLDEDGRVHSSVDNEMPRDENPRTPPALTGHLDLGTFDPMLSPYYVPEIFNALDQGASAADRKLLHLLLKLQGGTSVWQSCAYRQVKTDYPVYNRYLLEVVRVMVDARMSTQERRETLPSRIPMLAIANHGWSFTKYNNGLGLGERIDIRPPTAIEPRENYGHEQGGIRVLVYDRELIKTYEETINQNIGIRTQLDYQKAVPTPAILLTRSCKNYSLSEQLVNSELVTGVARLGLSRARAQFALYEETVKKAEIAVENVKTAFADPTTFKEKSDRLVADLQEVADNFTRLQCFTLARGFGFVDSDVLEREVKMILKRMHEFNRGRSLDQEEAGTALLTNQRSSWNTTDWSTV
ncbi:hypothetical protein GGR57DRAFT_506638 [Xylariaceae sp. FL1272]|nr:hypothetical protein GGR57DRAFT_506638 [Xylariaceae sp. FL1272]